mgnify:CR=1 FL=1
MFKISFLIVSALINIQCQMIKEVFIRSSDCLSLCDGSEKFPFGTLSEAFDQMEILIKQEELKSFLILLLENVTLISEQLKEPNRVEKNYFEFEEELKIEIISKSQSGQTKKLFRFSYEKEHFH